MRPKLRTVPMVLAFLAFAGIALAQQGAAARTADLVAVMDLDPVGAQKTQASAVTDRLREELLATGRYTLVSRDQMENLLTEQAVQQTGCTSQECAVQVGKMLGVRKIISGRLTRVEDNLWLMSVTMVDVETAKTERAASVTHDGKFITLMTDGVRQVSTKLTAQGGPGPMIRSTALSPAPPPVAALAPATVAVAPTRYVIRRIFQLPSQRVGGSRNAAQAADYPFDLKASAAELPPDLGIQAVDPATLPEEALRDFREDGWRGVFKKEPVRAHLEVIAAKVGADGLYGCRYEVTGIAGSMVCFLYGIASKQVHLANKSWTPRQGAVTTGDAMRELLVTLVKEANGVQ